METIRRPWLIGTTSASDPSMSWNTNAQQCLSLRSFSTYIPVPVSPVWGLSSPSLRWWDGCCDLLCQLKSDWSWDHTQLTSSGSSLSSGPYLRTAKSACMGLPLRYIPTTAPSSMYWQWWTLMTGVTNGWLAWPTTTFSYIIGQGRPILMWLSCQGCPALDAWQTPWGPTTKLPQQ